MAKTITHCDFVVVHVGTAPAGTTGQKELVRAHIEMPASEFAAFLVLSGLVDGTAAAATADVTAKIAALAAARAKNPVP